MLATTASGQLAPATAVFAGRCFWGVEGVFEHCSKTPSALGTHSRNP
jgi:peptide methionine sulfoxide reductase MsrA